MQMDMPMLPKLRRDGRLPMINRGLQNRLPLLLIAFRSNAKIHISDHQLTK